MIRNFARNRDDIDYPAPVIPYDLEKKLVRDFGGDERPEELIENKNLEKELVRNFGQKDGFVMPEDMQMYEATL